VAVEEDTEYPFGDDVEFVVNPAKPVRFPLYLRIPSWGENPTIEVNGKRSETKLEPGRVARIDREWKAGDKLKLSFPPKFSVKKWGTNNTVSFVRGPLTYSLEIKEKYVRYGGTDQWPAYDIVPDSAWNYGIDLNEKPSILETRPLPAFSAGRVWVSDGPIPLKVKARRIPAWTLDKRGLVNEIPIGPFKSSEPVETITLIPMGCARLRITAFPVIDNKSGKDWPAPPKPKYLATASHCWDGDSLDALCDDVLPKDSNDHGIDRFTWWPRKGSAEWVQYDFDKPTAVSSAAIYWFDDTPTKGGCKLPKSWRLLYKDGNAWKPVPEPGEYPVARDQFCEVKFQPVTTRALRLEVKLEKDYSGGILEWRVAK
jgi:hypothetical protein